MKQVTIHTTSGDHHLQVEDKIVDELVNLVPQTENQVYSVDVTADTKLHINVAHITAISESNLEELTDVGAGEVSDL